MKSYDMERTVELIIPRLIEKFIEYYGTECKDIIEKNLKNVDFIFESCPEIQYHFINEFPELFTKEEIDYVLCKYQAYIDVMNRAFEYAEKELFVYVNEHFRGLDFDNVSGRVSLFSDYIFNSYDIDSFSSVNIKLLNSNDVSEKVKRRIKEKQDAFLNNLNKYCNVSREFMLSLSFKVDDFLEFRSALGEQYINYIVKNAEYRRFVKEKLEKSMKCEVDDKVVMNLGNTDNSSAFSWSNDYANGCLINFCWVAMRNKSKKYMFLVLIHELIHAAESNGDVGIVDEENNNVVINEIRTQMLARRFVKELYDEGVFGFDASFDKLDQIDCNYEYLFPLVSDFFNKYEDIIKNIAFYNDSKELINCFGEYWTKFSKRIDEIYDEKIYRCEKERRKEIVEDEKCTYLISKMEEYYNKNCNIEKEIR